MHIQEYDALLVEYLGHIKRKPRSIEELQRYSTKLTEWYARASWEWFAKPGQTCRWPQTQQGGDFVSNRKGGI